MRGVLRPRIIVSISLMTNTVLQLDNVEFRRNRRVIITDVNLTINAGERWVLFGPNGIGKSTAV
ncbi:MAG: ATP-binding cassette domain-containing protein, partial [Bifidobacterium breve]|nr:ATP-binding cassette domain-containing protein [Bifidobacterium breve]